MTLCVPSLQNILPAPLRPARLESERDVHCGYDGADDEPREHRAGRKRVHILLPARHAPGEPSRVKRAWQWRPKKVSVQLTIGLPRLCPSRDDVFSRSEAWEAWLALCDEQLPGRVLRRGRCLLGASTDGARGRRQSDLTSFSDADTSIKLRGKLARFQPLRGDLFPRPAPDTASHTVDALAGGAP
jgi:hypothetical protein